MRIFKTLAIAALFLLITASGAWAQDDTAAPLGGSARTADVEKTADQPADEFITPTTYVYSTQSGVALEDMSSGTTQLLGPGGDNENSDGAQIGFLYRYDDVFFTSFGVNANGFLKLGGISTGVSSINLINSTANAPKIMPYWDDLCISNFGKVHYKLVGAPGSQKLVIEWKNMKITKGNSCNGTGSGTFQLWLFERSGLIQFVYGDGMVTAATPNGGYSIGIQSGAATNFASVTTADNSVSYSVANNVQITAIQTGTSYIFTPNLPPAPSGLSATNMTQTSVTINWTDNAFSETAYLVRRTTDGINYFFVGNTLPANSTSFTENGLEPGFQYTYVVNALSEGAFSADASVVLVPIPPRIISSTGSGGPWSSPSTWVGGTIPDTYDNVTIVSGASVTIDTANALARDVTIGTGGSPATLQFGENGAFALKVTRDVTVGANDFFKTGSGNANQHVLTVGGNITNNGTLDFSTNNNQAGAGIVFNGATSATFGGSGPVTDIRTITIDKGTSSANILELTAQNFTVQGSTTDGPASAYLFLVNGTFKISGTFTGNHRTLASAAYQIVITAGLWLNNPNYTVTPQSATVGFFGLFRLSAGSYNVGTGTGHMAYYRTGSTVIVEGGSLTVTGGLQGGGVSTFAITGGKITTCTWGLSGGTGAACFDFGSAGGGQTIAMTGGDMVVQNPPGVGGIYLNRTPNTQMGATVLHFGNALTAGAGIFSASGYIPNIHIDTTGGNHRFLFTSGGSSNSENYVRNITLDPGGTVEFGSAGFGPPPLHFMGDTFINNGVFKSTDGTLSIDPSQTDFQYTGSGTMTGCISSLKIYRNLVFGINVGNVRVRNIEMNGGNIVNASKLIIGNNDPQENKITFFSGVVGTFDSAPVFEMGPGWQDLEYQGARTTGPEINPARTINIFKFDNPGVLTIAGGDITITNGFGVLQGEIFTGPYKLILTANNGNPNGLANSPIALGYDGYVNGTIKQRIAQIAAYTFPMGHNGYSPVKVKVTALGINPSWVTVSNFDTILPGLLPANSVSRYWKVTEEGDITATLSFSYQDTDVHGNENSFTLWRSTGGTPAPVAGSAVSTATNTATSPAGLTSFDGDWGIGAQLDGPVSISGTVKTSGGQPIRNAQVIISGGNLPAPVTFVTGTFGTYLFEGLEAGQTYHIKVSVKRYRFPAGGQDVTPLGNVTGIDFIANPQE